MNITESYLSRAELWMLITTITYFLMNGAQIFETTVLVPKWTGNPPESFSLLADKNGTSLKTFWIIFHSLHELTFILAIAFCWKLEGLRNGLLILFVVHFAVRVWTLTYFAPNIIEFQKISEGLISPTDLVKRANLWKALNYIRVGIFIAVSIGLVPLLLKLINLKQN
ncbi:MULTISPECIES: transposase [unclassified Arenibacter]|uniref:transposase n=1 Tax=unclassified Arenibacter TaxID=2615047 RepID=UPI000E356971|nr:MULTISPECIES: transposase [unclassified Arenibacter]MCM4162401.1 transposase [Arenibacter sp. A80]RFT57996.1 transposase [Arenibacter sp. P308M17]